MSNFDHIPEAPADPIFQISVAYKNDKNQNKLDLGVGAYRTEEGNPYVLKVVRKAEEIMLAKKDNKEYLPIDGNQQFIAGAKRLVFGENSAPLKENRISAIQALGGTGALAVGGFFLNSFFKGVTVYLSDPTWGNHKNIFERAGLKTAEYKYYNYKTCGLNLDGFLSDIRAAPSGSAFLLHACAHNPTGVDPTLEQWKLIADAIAEKNHIPFFDFAYQGFASGDIDTDAQAIRLFVDRGLQIFVAQSFSKNLGLYCERLGCFMIVCQNDSQNVAITSQLKRIARGIYSNPPAHGSRVAATIFDSPELYADWKVELREMSGRLSEMRQKLHDAIVERKIPGDWSHLQTQVGMFSFLGLSVEQVKKLTEDYHIYMTTNSRVSVAGLSAKTVPYFANSIQSVVNSSKL